MVDGVRKFHFRIHLAFENVDMPSSKGSYHWSRAYLKPHYERSYRILYIAIICGTQTTHYKNNIH